MACGHRRITTDDTGIFQLLHAQMCSDHGTGRTCKEFVINILRGDYRTESYFSFLGRRLVLKFVGIEKGGVS